MTTGEATGQHSINIEPDEVEAAFVASLYKEDEIEGDNVPEGAVLVEGIMGKYGFQPERLEEHREQVRAWLRLLPTAFHEKEGGGWSFLNACNQENGVQWTGLHQRMEQLFCLGIGLGLVRCQLPREMWSALPRGMPYYVIVAEPAQ